MYEDEDEDDFISIKNKYNEFKKLLSEKIKDSEYDLDTEDEECYLIGETWNNELLKCFDKYENLKKKERNIKL